MISPGANTALPGFDATAIAGFDSAAASQRWTGSPYQSEHVLGSPRYQSQNPANYLGWTDQIGTYRIANAYRSEEDREYLTRVRNFFTEDVDSLAGVWTARWWDESLVTMFGIRRDRVTETWYEHDFREDGLEVDVVSNRSTRSTTVESRSGSLKLNVTRLAGLSGKLPFDVHLLYAIGEVQTPDPRLVDVFGRTLPNSTGDTEDASIMITSADRRWSFRATHYRTAVENTPLVR